MAKEKSKKGFGVFGVHADGSKELLHAPFTAKDNPDHEVHGDFKAQAESCRDHHERVYKEQLAAKEKSLNKAPGSLSPEIEFVVEEVEV